MRRVGDIIMMALLILAIGCTAHESRRDVISEMEALERGQFYGVGRLQISRSRVAGEAGGVGMGNKATADDATRSVNLYGVFDFRDPLVIPPANSIVRLDDHQPGRMNCAQCGRSY